MSSQTNQEIQSLLKQLRKTNLPSSCVLLNQKHIAYLKKVIHGLKESVLHFDVAQPWVYYYIIHSLKMLGSELSESDQSAMTHAIKYCWNGVGGGFGGGYLQQGHLAPTYASFLTLLELGTSEAYQLINRDGLYNFFKKCKQGGQFQMHVEGECDLRASYIVVIIAKLLKMQEDILQGVAQTIIQSQTYQGGISNTIGGEAHGGFTFCGVAALAVLGQLHKLDISRLMFWLSHRQVEFGGFNGRTSKLLDSCYSFWIGSTFNIVNNYFQGKCSWEDHLLYCQQDLKRYVLLYCQDQNAGGLWDKPGKPRDIYHTCYALSGLTLSMANVTKEGSHKNKSKNTNKQTQDITIQAIDPIYNIIQQSLEIARHIFSSNKVVEDQQSEGK